ncbi:MAG: GAF domain-containing protein [Defluviitaleaceae bacterium]|nr:GAF domain-containing protein [Defluviitaleaceae bacterium]
MRKQIMVRLSTIIEAVLIAAVFVLLFLTLSQNRADFVLFVGCLLTISVFIYTTVRARNKRKRDIALMTEEMSAAAHNLSYKSYQESPDDLRVFFDELVRVKALLRKRDKSRHELLDIANTVALNIEFDLLLRDLLPKVNEATRSNCSAFYTVNPSSGKLEIKHSVGFGKNIYGEFDMALDEGLAGTVTAGRETIIISNIPEDTIYSIRTFLGKIKPRSMMVVPVMHQDQVNGVLICASIYDYTHEDKEMVELVKYYLGVAVANGVRYERTKRLTSELTFQNKLIQDQHEAMNRKLNDKDRLLHCLINREIGCAYATDSKGVIQLWNKATERLTGVTADEAEGRLAEKIFALAGWPYDAEAHTKTETEGTHQFCIWRGEPDGRNRRFEVNAECIKGDKNETVCFLFKMYETW